MSKTSGISAARHAAIFGPPDDIWSDEKAGRKRKCKTCGDWHPLNRPWPHNCRPPQKNMQILAAPLLMPDVQPHVHDGEYIGSRQEQREFMKKRGLVEHEDFTETAGTHKQDIGSRAYEDDLMKDIKRVMEEDPLNRPPPEMIEQANDKVTEDEIVSADGIDIIGETEDRALRNPA